MKGKNTFEKIKENMDIARIDGDKFYNDGNKSAGIRARKALDAIAKLKVQWRKESV